MDCTEAYSPCKCLSAVSFVNGCWLVNTTQRPSVVGKISHHRRSRKDFIRKIKQNRPDIELRWMLQKPNKGNKTTRAMWEESEGVMLFTCIKPKHFLY